METRKAPQEQQKSIASAPTRRVHTIEHGDFENYLDDVDRCRECIAGLAAVMDLLDTGRLHHESQTLIEASHGFIAAEVATILAVCATEIRIDTENFRHHNPADDEGGIQ